jgi:hypothetical protein
LDRAHRIQAEFCKRGSQKEDLGLNPIPAGDTILYNALVCIESAVHSCHTCRIVQALAQTTITMPLGIVGVVQANNYLPAPVNYYSRPLVNYYSLPPVKNYYSLPPVNYYSLPQ